MLRLLLQLHPRNGKNGESASAFFSLIDGFAYFVDIVWDFRDQDDVCAACDSGVQSQPAYFMTHNLYDKNSLVRGSCCMDAVDRIGCNIDGTVETEVISVP